jgi:hypothetical protein
MWMVLQCPAQRLRRAAEQIGKIIADKIVVVAAAGNHSRQGLEVFSDVRFATGQRRIDIGRVSWH